MLLTNSEKINVMVEPVPNECYSLKISYGASHAKLPNIQKQAKRTLHVLTEEN